MSDTRKVAQPIVLWGTVAGQEAIDPLLRRADRIARVRQDIEGTLPQELGEVGYIARAFIACTLPHRDPKAKEFVRANGPYRLTLMGTRGVPFGKVPRVLIGFVQTEVVRSQDREIRLGATLTEAVERLRLHDGGTTLKTVSEQLHRTVATLFELVYDNPADRLHHELRFILSSQFRYRYDVPKQVELWDPTITVSEDLFRELVNDQGGGGVPYDWRMMRALRSPLAIDLYLWATHTTWRIRDLGQTLKVPLVELQRAFGTGFPETTKGGYNFQVHLASALSDVRALWPGLPVALTRGAVTVEPGRPHVQPLRRLLPPRE